MGLLRRSLYVIITMLIIAGGSVQGQSVGGYLYETGVDATLWIDMGNAQRYTDPTQMIDLGFEFYFCGYYYRQLSIDWTGTIGFDPISESSFFNTIPPLIDPYGVVLSAVLVQWTVVGVAGSRKCVIEYEIYVDVEDRRPIQVQLSEQDGSILFLYGNREYAYQSIPFWIGFKGENGTTVNVNMHNQVGPEVIEWLTGFGDWPGENRYYRFVPESIPCCFSPNRVNVRHVTEEQATVNWRFSNRVPMYEFSYRQAETNQEWTTVISADTNVLLYDLLPQTDYEYSVRSICSPRCSSDSVKGTFKTMCMLDAVNQINFADLYADNVICRIGNYLNPSIGVRVVDYGYDNPISRHTVHTDTSERDSLTGSLLRTIPEGRCRSVRLGNRFSRAEEESITYILKVDTNLFDLLLLRYAIVEEEPGHESEDQPKFIMRVLDSAGVLVDSCYYANFVAGRGDDMWHSGMGIVVWRDWTTVGIDLTPLHGKTIYVMLDNYDCSQGAHFGYTYFTLESGFKQLQSAYCGNTDTNIFYAPKGFSYRWYRADREDSTLSRADSLLVVGEGVYRCRASFVNSDSSCGVTMTTHAGTRFPMAAFSVVAKDTCGYSFKFENHSVVTRDEAHTQRLNEACEQYLWRFGDGAESSAINPTHDFETGTYDVELVAMLANGQCRDSVRQTIVANHVSDTVYDTICVGGTYNFHNVNFNRAGFYTVDVGCWRHALQLSLQQYFYQEKEDTVCQGEAYQFCDEWFDSAGVYELHLTSVEGCDSSYLLTLTTHPLPVSSYEIAMACQEMLYYYLKGTYRMADQSMEEPGSVAFVGEDGLLYRWSASSAIASLPYLTEDGEVRIAPRQPTTYYVQCEYMEGLACPVVDTIELLPLKEVVAALEVSPEWLGYDKMDITAIDRSRHAVGRRWLVDDEEQDEDGPLFYFEASSDADSVKVAVVAYNDVCIDTAEKVVPVLRHLLMFPNVFTPSLATNNRFGPIGFGITDYELWIYDRRGALVFHSTDMEEQWDGTCNGIPLRQEAYAYTCSYTTPTHDRLTTTGTVTLLR